MKVAILLACYNGEKFVRKQLDSILGQDLRDFTLYVSDDGSSDATAKILSEYSVTDGRVKILPEHAPNGSACKHFLQMLETVESDLYLFSDQDDVWTADHVSRLVERYAQLSDNEKRLPTVIHSDLSVADRNLEVICESFFDYALLSRHPAHRHSYFLENNVTGGAMLVNAALKGFVFRDRKFLSMNLYRIPMHDHFFALVANQFGQVLFVDEKLELYRQHSENAVGAKNVKTLKNYFQKLLCFDAAWLESSIALTSFFLEYYPDRIPDDEKKVLQEFLKIRQMSRLQALRFIIRHDFWKESKRRQVRQVLSILFGRFG